MTQKQKEALAQRIHNKLVRDIVAHEASDADPNGSYTGNPIDGGTPVQDADDL